MKKIREGKWQHSAGKVHNPGKSCFLKFGVDAVRDVNRQKDSNRLAYARKAMIMAGMALNTNFVWEEG